MANYGRWTAIVNVSFVGGALEDFGLGQEASSLWPVIRLNHKVLSRVNTLKSFNINGL